MTRFKIYFNLTALSKYEIVSQLLEKYGFKSFGASYEIRASDKQLETIANHVKYFIYIYEESCLYADDSVIFRHLTNHYETVENLRELIEACHAANIFEIGAKILLECKRDQFAQIISSLCEELEICEVALHCGLD